MSDLQEVDPRKLSQEQFFRLFLQAERELIRYVAVLVPNVADARDVLQETAVALWEKVDEYDPDRPFIAWASRFALNKARMHLRTQARRQKRLADDVVETLEETRIEHAQELDERRVFLRDCLGRLPDRQRDIIQAHYFDDLTVEEVGARFKRSVEAIYKVLQRTRRSLHECIERKLVAEGEL